MEQKENPVDAGTSVPDKENPYADLITLLFDSSILAPLSLVGDQLPDDAIEVYDFGMMRNAEGCFLSIYLKTTTDLKYVNIPYKSALVLMSCICGAARPDGNPRAYPISAVPDQ